MASLKRLWIGVVAGLAVSMGEAGLAEQAELPEDPGPVAMAVSADGSTLVVACAESCELAWIRFPAGEVFRRTPQPARPTGLVLTADGAQVIVTCAAPRSSVLAWSMASGELLWSLEAGHTAMGPAVSADGSRLYVCNRFSNDVSVIDLPSHRERARVPAVREPIAAAVAPDGRTVLVANHLPNARIRIPSDREVKPVVQAIDAATLESTAIALQHGSSSVRDICVSPDGQYALVTHLLSNFEQTPFRVDLGWINVNVVSIIDIAQRKAIRTIGLDRYDEGVANPWGIVYSADGQSVCVSIAGGHALGVIGSEELVGDFARRTMQPLIGAWPIYTSLGVSLWDRIPLPGNGPRGLAVAGSKVFVAEYFSNTVAVVDLAAPAKGPASIPLGPVRPLSQRREGERLFNDAAICFQGWQSCASCHPDGRVDGLNWDLMNDGVGNPKNTKSMLLAHETPPSMAEGVRATAEEAVRSGMLHILFSRRPEAEAVAVDAYLTALQPEPSPYRVDGKLSESARRGRRLFESPRVGCARCHPAPDYTDLGSHDVGSRGPGDTASRFDTPALVEAWRTAPYLHDGRYLTVSELLKEGRHGLPAGVELTEQERSDLAVFVLSL